MVLAKLGNVINNYLNDGDNVIADYDGDSSDAYLRGYLTSGLDNNEILFTPDPSSPDDLHYYFKDALGNIRQIINDSEVPDIEGYYDYYAFGDEYSSETSNFSGNRYRFTARELNSESDMYFYRARIYSQSLSRFVSQDLEDYINRYYYCNNNPIMFSDPLGLNPDSDTDAMLKWMKGYAKSRNEKKTEKQKAEETLKGYKSANSPSIKKSEKQIAKETVKGLKRANSSAIKSCKPKSPLKYQSGAGTPGGANIYGNYCGKGGYVNVSGTNTWTGPAPIDGLDECCQDHDKCYIDCEYRGLGAIGGAGVLCGYTPGSCNFCCDMKLCACIASNIPYLSSFDEFSASSAVWAFFRCQPITILISLPICELLY